VRTTLASGRRFKGRSLTVQVRGNDQTIARLGLIVPKRCLPRAVDRNRVKRVLREWFRIHQAGLAGRDVLVRLVARPQDLRGLSQEMSGLLPQARVAPAP
jgi:ribonuclease P protein component